MRAIGACLAWVFVECAHAQGISPRDFASGYPIIVPSEASAYRFVLPLTIYQGTVHEDLRDLAVFNSRGEAVPFFIRPSVPDVEEAHGPEVLPLFPLLGAISASASEMRVIVDSPGVALRMNSSGAASVADLPRQYILDARALDDSVAAMQLVWAQKPSGYSGRMRIEWSNDLDSWQTVVAAAPVAILQASDKELLHARIEFPATKGNYWRLSWVGGPPNIPLTKVIAEYAEKRGELAWSIETAVGREDTRQPADYEFDLRGHIPVERVDLRLAEPNSVVVAELYSRKDAKDAWRFVTRERFYRIHAARGDDHNQPVDIPLNRDRYWLARIPAGNPTFTGALSLVAAWHPSEVVFLSQGSPPFVLAYGSGTSWEPHTDLSSFIAKIAVVPATLGDVRQLGGMTRLSAPTAPVQLRRWILWLVLLGAMVVLTYMASRLIKGTGAPES